MEPSNNPTLHTFFAQVRSVETGVIVSSTYQGEREVQFIR